MRKLLSISGVLVMLCVVALWARGGDDARFELGPFEDLYALQAETGLDFGYSEGERFPGHGGSGVAAEITLVLPDVSLTCRRPRFDIIAKMGVVMGGKISCAVADLSDPAGATAAAEEIIARFEQAEGWTLRTDNRVDPRRAEEFGRTVESAYDFVVAGGWNTRMERVPIIRFTHTSDTRFGLDVGQDRRFSPPDLRILIDFGFESPCWHELSAYEIADIQPERTTPEHYARLKQRFGGRTFDDVPVAERVAGFAEYLRNECGRG